MHSLCTHQATWYPALIADASGHFEDLIQAQSQSGPSGTAEVTKDGTYTVSLSNIKGTGVDEETGEEKLLPAACEGAAVFNVDIPDLGTT